MRSSHNALWIAIGAVLVSAVPILLVLVHGSAGPGSLDSTQKLIRAIVAIVCPVATAALAGAAYLASARRRRDTFRRVRAVEIALLAGSVAFVSALLALLTTEYFPPGA